METKKNGKMEKRTKKYKRKYVENIKSKVGEKSFNKQVWRSS